MEISGYDPEISICKIGVLPIKLYPLYSLFINLSKVNVLLSPNVNKINNLITSSTFTMSISK